MGPEWHLWQYQIVVRLRGADDCGRLVLKLLLSAGTVVGMVVGRCPISTQVLAVGHGRVIFVKRGRRESMKRMGMHWRDV